MLLKALNDEVPNIRKTAADWARNVVMHLGCVAGFAAISSICITVEQALADYRFLQLATIPITKDLQNCLM